MGYRMFSINGNDFTSNILVPSYVVNKDAEYNKWTDANYEEHRDIKRFRISGSFKMYFDDQNDYLNFLQLIRDNETDDGYVETTLYINNLNTTTTANVYIDVPNLVNNLPYLETKKHDGFTVQIRER